MPDMTSTSGPEPPATTPETKPKGKRRMIVVGALCLGLAAGGYLISGRMAGGAAPAAGATTEEEVVEPEPEVGEIVDLEPVNVNLADGHYLRIGVSLGLSAHVEGEAGEEAAAASHGEAGEETGTTFPTAPAADLVLSTFSGRSIEQLADDAGREAARHDLLEGIHAYYGEEEILTVFFTEFVMQ